MPDSIETALEQAILKTWRGKETPEGGFQSFWMSSLGRCPRFQIAQRAGLPQTHPPDARSIYKMRVGEVIGRDIQNLLEGSGFLDPMWREKPVSYRFYTGKLDGLTHTLNGDCLVEIKTMDDNAITKPDLPEHFLWQCYGYCLATGIHSLLLFCLGKNQGLAKNRLLALTEEWKKKIDEEITRIEGLWDVCHHGISLPQCEHRFKFEDKWCPYRGETEQEKLRDLKEDSDAD